MGDLSNMDFVIHCVVKSLRESWSCTYRGERVAFWSDTKDRRVYYWMMGKRYGYRFNFSNGVKVIYPKVFKVNPDRFKLKEGMRVVEI